MTQLERIVAASVRAATATTLANTTSQIAEEMARELLRDPQFRAKMRRLIDEHFTATLTELSANGRKKKAGRTKRTARRAER